MTNWNEIATSLKLAIGNPELASRWQLACLVFLGDGKIAKADPQKKARVLLHGLGRGRALLHSAVEWDMPCIGQDSDPTIARLRGLLWRYLMAYTGWETMAKSVLWNGSRVQSMHPEWFLHLLDSEMTLHPPFRSRSEAPPALQNWLETEKSDHVSLPDFLGLHGNHEKFINWLIGKENGLNSLQVLASMRHVVAHGNLSPTKAISWGLEDLYSQTPLLLLRLAERLEQAITPPQAVVP